jgi:hypothetical protein
MKAIHQKLNPKMCSIVVMKTNSINFNHISKCISNHLLHPLQLQKWSREETTTRKIKIIIQTSSHSELSLSKIKTTIWWKRSDKKKKKSNKSVQEKMKYNKRETDHTTIDLLLAKTLQKLSMNTSCHLLKKEMINKLVKLKVQVKH